MTIISIVADAAAVAALLLSDDVRDWVKQNPFVLFWVTAGLIVVFAVFANRAAARLRKCEGNRIAELQKRDDEHASALRTRDEQLDGLKVEIQNLERRLHPTLRDKDTFAELLKLFPWEKGAMMFLEHGFNAKKWRGVRVDDLYGFTDGWRERFFDDMEVQDVFIEFRSCCENLTVWLGANGFACSDALPNGDYVYEIVPASERQGGWAEYDAVRDEGLEAARNMLEVRRKIERVGRARGL
ncbi:hypothetical protein [Sphaerisporangium rubeum]|uniref:Uncharacterized protein n=1 Tax=Sphaerisporangium rubeum TaxID=321317 RepID=A0A7X0M8F9_9ACTN|nr:hypothetical protein [Sphaerisporangium rubeum]MBB6475322.1 hypothetical protein [Sphaerisporangium rubeum]